MKAKKKAFTFVILFFPLLFLTVSIAPYPSIRKVKAQETLYPIVYRGLNYEDVDYGNGTHVWRNMPQAVWNGSHWVDYVYFRDDAKKCYVVRTGLVAGEVYDSGVVKFWDVNMTEERVKSEVWQVWMWDGKAWKEATLNVPISFSVVENSTGVFINASRTTSKPNGVLTVIYCFHVGSPLKHWVFWKSNESTNQTVMVKQVWDLAGFITKCKVNGAETSASGSYNATQFLFYNETDSYLVFEDQSSMFEKLKPTSIDFSGKKVIFAFSNWTLMSGETLTIDPSTTTLKPNTTYKAYYGTSSSEVSDPSGATTEFTSAMYSQVQADDGSYAYTTKSPTPGSVMHRFTFNLTEFNNPPTKSISGLFYKYDGQALCSLGKWGFSVKESGTWRRKSEAPVSDGPGWERTGGYNDTTAITNNVFEFGLYAYSVAGDDPAYISSDAVELVVTYIEGGKVFQVANNVECLG